MLLVIDLVFSGLQRLPCSNCCPATVSHTLNPVPGLQRLVALRPIKL